MENFVNFLNEYKELLVSALCVLLTLISVIVKRRPKSVNELLDALHIVATELPELISRIESPGFGEVKKRRVISVALSHLRIEYGRSLSSDEVILATNYFSDKIESILETPQKKGVSK